jgi:DNA-binding MarR family transcriptional regulator
MQNLIESLEALGMDCLAAVTRRTARAVTNYINVMLRPVDLNVGQFGLLMVIAKKPDRTMREIGEILILDDSTMTRNLAVLERRGLVQGEGGRGRGGKRVSLTDEGVSILSAGLPLWLEANERIAAAMAPSELEAGVRFLDSLAQAAERLNPNSARLGADAELAAS